MCIGTHMQLRMYVNEKMRKSASAQMRICVSAFPGFTRGAARIGDEIASGDLEANGGKAEHHDMTGGGALLGSPAPHRVGEIAWKFEGKPLDGSQSLDGRIFGSG